MRGLEGALRRIMVVSPRWWIGGAACVFLPRVDRSDFCSGSVFKANNCPAEKRSPAFNGVEQGRALFRELVPAGLAWLSSLVST